MKQAAHVRAIHPLQEDYKRNQETAKMTAQLCLTNSKLDQAVGMLQAQFTMLSTLLQSCSDIAPKFIIFLPAPKTEALKIELFGQTIQTPEIKVFGQTLSPSILTDLVSKKICVYFVDPITLEPAGMLEGKDGGIDKDHKCGPAGKGFDISFPAQWVAQAMPYIATGMKVAKFAKQMGMLQLIPGASFIEEQFTELTEQAESFMDGALEGMSDGAAGVVEGLVEGAKEMGSSVAGDDGGEMTANLARHAMDQVKATFEDVADDCKEDFDKAKQTLTDAEDKNKHLNEEMQAPLKKSVKEINKILGGCKSLKQTDKWEEMTGLVKVA